MNKFFVFFVVFLSTFGLASADSSIFLPSPSTQQEEVSVQPTNLVPSDVVISGNNLILLRGPISGSTASSITEQLLTAQGKEVYLFIDSPGGSVIAASRIMASMRSSGKKVVCVAETAISAAFMILQACNVRLITYSGITMQHNASLAVGRKEIPNFQTFTQFIYRMLDITTEFQAKRIGMTTEEFTNLTKDDWWLFSFDAVARNVVDGLVTVRCTEDAIKGRVSITVQTMFGSGEFKFSKCPVLADPIADNQRRTRNQEEGIKALFSKEPIRDPLYMEDVQ